MFVDKEGKPLRDIDEVYDEYQDSIDQLWDLIRKGAPKEKQLSAYLKYRKSLTEYRFLQKPEEWKWVDN